jgi:hypothetical protein
MMQIEVFPPARERTQKKIVSVNMQEQFFVLFEKRCCRQHDKRNVFFLSSSSSSSSSFWKNVYNYRKYLFQLSIFYFIEHEKENENSKAFFLHFPFVLLMFSSFARRNETFA